MHTEQVRELKGETAELKKQLRQAEEALKSTREGLENEQRRNTALMYSKQTSTAEPRTIFLSMSLFAGDLPLKMLKDSSTGASKQLTDNTNSLSRTYSMATIVQW